MASVSILNLSIMGAGLAAGDYFVVADVSDTTQSAGGSDVRISVTNFFATVSVPINITSASATAFAVGRLGATTPAFSVDASTASQVAGLKVTGAGTGGTVAVVVTDSGANASLTLNAKGSGTIGIGSVSTGAVTITPATTITGALTQTGLATFNGGATVASGQTLTVTGATITGLTAASVGTGTFPGVYTITGAVTLSAALTYGGVTLSNAVTGTGNMVLSASPTLTGTIGAASMTLSGTLGVTGVATFTTFPVMSALTASQAVFTDGSKGLVSNAITGTGNVVMSASPTLTGTIGAAAMTLSSTLGVTGDLTVGASTFVVSATTGAATGASYTALVAVDTSAAIFKATSSGDRLDVVVRAAGNGVQLNAYNTGATDYALMLLQANGFTFKSRNGAGTTTNVLTMSSAQSTFAGPLAITGALTGVTTLNLTTQPAFVAGSKYLVIDASGNVQVSALGPAS